MAHENQGIVDIVKNCKILLLDIEGTTTSISFVKDKLFPYAEENVKQFLEGQWETDDVKEVVESLRKLALEDQEKNMEGFVAIPGEDASKEDQIDGLVKSVKWQMSLDRKVGPLKLLQGLIWKQGYDKGDIKGHVYDDVLPALEQWHATDGQKVYIYSSGSVQAQKLLFGQTLVGNLLKYIDGHFDTAVGAKQESASYTKIVEQIECKPEDILFLTDIVKEAEAARTAGLHTALVCREGNAPLSEEATATFPVIHTFAQLVSNKRKQDPQEELPAKVPKTDIEIDVKTTSEATKSMESKISAKKSDKPEQMEVEGEVAPMKETNKEMDEAKEIEKVETVVEEITDFNEASDIPVCDVEPVVIEEKMEADETIEKTEEKPSEKQEVKLDAKSVEPNTNATSAEKATEVAEETPPIVVTEIEEITENKEDVSNEAEIIEDLEPVVSEPPAIGDNEELQNVGEVLEKECDEILSKVQNVTNLDNIYIKPLLESVPEEAMETDSNDIMDRILDSELEMKQSEDIDLNTVEEKKMATNSVAEEVILDKNVTDDEKTVVSANEMNTVTEEKVEESSPVENNFEEAHKSEKKPTGTYDQKVEDTKTGDHNATESEKVVEQTQIDKTEVTIEKTPEEAKPEDNKVAQFNGKSTNGDSTADLNGDASKDEALSSRLSVENGKETVENGKEVNSDNGDSTNGEKGQGDAKEAEGSDIKVKSVATDEMKPLEQPTEA